ncbi:SDR family NAD(P)-dependent oxidoreductase [Roseimaritima sediminicola]|uniref:SDR family NAD(P)-dependent oxidoreductase n=1 Tax=Roseimaritima sediminicola TaxID=2662066 RepID=UPI00129844A1|nr:SDR family oxidoreductase [Roseimaritima sediminicola]
MTSKHYLIIGGSHGIGLELVRRLRADGAAVTVVSRTRGDLGTVSEVSHIEADVTAATLRREQLPEVVDGLAYCPGSIQLAPLRSITPELLLEDYRLNVVAAVQCVQAALPALKAAQQAAIVLFSTVAVSQGLAMHTSVAAAKGAVEGLTRSLAAELAPAIRVNCVAPALTDTPLAERFLQTEEKRKAMAKRYPLKRVGQPIDVANVAALLLGDQSDWITGQVIAVDGGMSRVRV